MAFVVAAQFVAFVVAILFFHISEFLLAYIFHGRVKISIDNLLISWAYVKAMSFGLLEYVIHSRVLWMWEISIQRSLMPILGAMMVVTGEVIRKTGIITARSNFSHKIVTTRLADHSLVTTGIYSRIRHPGYLGWMLWAPGTQLLLGNPISTVVYGVVSWKFFQTRIKFEDAYLHEFFGESWKRYSEKVPSGILGIP